MSIRYYCHFCVTPCQPGPNGNGGEWHDCMKCNVQYLADSTGKLLKLILNNYDDFHYELQLDHVKNTSAINIIPYDPEDTIVMIARFPFLLKNVTPENMMFKIKTSVVFS